MHRAMALRSRRGLEATRTIRSRLDGWATRASLFTPMQDKGLDRLRLYTGWVQTQPEPPISRVG